MCSLSKEQSILSRETIQSTLFFQNYVPFLLGHLSSIKHPTAVYWHPHGMLFFFLRKDLIVNFSISCCNILSWVFINPLSNNLMYQQLQGRSLFQNIVGKGENAGNQHFLLLPLCFLSNEIQTLPFQKVLMCRPQTS